MDAAGSARRAGWSAFWNETVLVACFKKSPDGLFRTAVTAYATGFNPRTAPATAHELRTASREDHVSTAAVQVYHPAARQHRVRVASCTLAAPL